jgi:hypothetical protein
MVSYLPTDLSKPRPKPPMNDDDRGFSAVGVGIGINVGVVTKSKKFSSFSVDSLLFKKESKILSGTEKPDETESTMESGFRRFFRKGSETKSLTDDHIGESDDDLGNYFVSTQQHNHVIKPVYDIAITTNERFL